MPGVRSKGQIMIGCWCKESFVAKIDKIRGVLTRSQFCREALASKLQEMGIGIDRNEHIAPDRTGKGGPRTKSGRYPAHTVSNLNLNEKASSVDQVAKAGAKKAIQGLKGGKP